MEKNNFDKRKEYVNKINELTIIVGDQIYYENSNFLINLRKIAEGVITLFSEEKNNYEFYDFNNFEKKKKIKEYIKSIIKDNKFIENYLDLVSELSLYAHFNIESNSNEQKLTYGEIRKIINKMNDIINEISKDGDNLKKIKLDNEIEQSKNSNKIIWLKENVETLNEKKFIDIINNIYKIPIFQRTFKWESEEIIKFIVAINNTEIYENYDLGIFYITDKKRVLVDGQQRLITINIITNLLKIFFKEKIEFEKKILNSNLKIERERKGTNWRNDSDKLYENLTKANKEENYFFNIYKKIRELINGNSNFLLKLKNVKVNFKKIKDKDSILYFNRINNEGIKLTNFENLITKFLHFNKFDENSKNKIYESYNKYDEIKNENIKKIINKIALLKINKYPTLGQEKDIKFIQHISNTIYLLDNCIYIKNYKISNSDNINIKLLNDKDYEIILFEIMVNIFYLNNENQLEVLLLKTMKVMNESDEIDFNVDFNKNLNHWRKIFFNKEQWIFNFKFNIYFKKILEFISKMDLVFEKSYLNNNITNNLILFLNKKNAQSLIIANYEFEFWTKLRQKESGFLKYNALNNSLFIDARHKNLPTFGDTNIEISSLEVGCFLIEVIMTLLDKEIEINKKRTSEKMIDILFKISEKYIISSNWKERYKIDSIFRQQIDNNYELLKNEPMNLGQSFYASYYLNEIPKIIPLFKIQNDNSNIFISFDDLFFKHIKKEDYSKLNEKIYKFITKK